MKHIATVALMLNLGVAGIYAQQKPVKSDVFGKYCGHYDQSTARHNYRRRAFRR